MPGMPARKTSASPPYAIMSEAGATGSMIIAPSSVRGGQSLVRGSFQGGRSATRRRRGLLTPSGLPWILPAFVVIVGVIYYSIGYTAYMSTLNWDGTAPPPIHVGAANFVQAFHDPIFWLALRHTGLFFVVTFTVQTAIGFTLATLLHSQIRFKTFYKVIVFIPVVLAPATMAPVFREIFSYTGQLNSVLNEVGLNFLTRAWLAEPDTALPVIMVITVWEWTGLTFVLYYAALSQIDKEIIEAARIDGAGNIRTIASIVWPSARGTTIAILILSIIGSLKTFDVPYLVTLGGPNFATEFLGTMIYRESIPLGEVGYGAALSVLLLSLALVMAIIVSWRARRSSREERRV
jgi:raffinose/stachyose/melibiose transport system permease protein